MFSGSEHQLNRKGPTNLEINVSKHTNPPIDMPAKKRVVPREILREFEISVIIALEIGILPSNKPFKKRTTRLTQKLVVYARAIRHKPFTMIKNLKRNYR